MKTELSKEESDEIRNLMPESLRDKEQFSLYDLLDEKVIPHETSPFGVKYYFRIESCGNGNYYCGYYKIDGRSHSHFESGFGKEIINALANYLKNTEEKRQLNKRLSEDLDFIMDLYDD